MTFSLPIWSPPIDAFSRRVEYLRISVTDRCNYRCHYCMPEAGVSLVPKAEVLSFEEIERLVQALLPLGIRRVRLTGGEPTVRKDLVELVARLARLELDDLAMTTNGERLVELALPLRQAGLARLNVSIDSLRPRTFVAMTRRGVLSNVLDGVEQAIRVGFVGTKINTVVVGGQNDDELDALCAYAWERNLTPRFIEFMPMSEGSLFSTGSFVAAATIRTRLETGFGRLVVDQQPNVPGVGPARYYRVVGGTWAGRKLGLIAAVTEPFCDTCNRVRLSATGGLHTCLADDRSVDFRLALRQGATEEELRALFRWALLHKQKGHEFTTCGSGGPRKHMVAIGG